MPTVSVVIATYNRPKMLKSAMDSVLAQDFTDFELIVVDDGSSQDTSDVVKSYADLRVIYLRQTQSGRSVARNAGLKASKGRYIALLDDDDLYLPHKLRFQVHYLDSHPDIDAVAGSATLLYELQHRGPEFYRAAPRETVLSARSCLYSCPVIPTTVMLRATGLELLDEWFDPEMDREEDADFFTRFVLSGGRLSLLPDVVSIYRIHGGSSQTNGARLASAKLRCIEKALAMPRCPEMTASETRTLYASAHLTGALLACSTGQGKDGQRRMQDAVDLDPLLGVGNPPPLVATVAAFARTFHVADPAAFIDYTFDHLPRSLIQLQRHRRVARSLYHMGRFFTAKSEGIRPGLGDWVKGIWYSPGWVMNRGAWVIVLRDVCGSGLSQGVGRTGVGP